MGLRPLLAAVKCNNMAMARLLIDHGAHIHQQNCKRSELHALAETQKGPYPPVRVPLLAYTHHRKLTTAHAPSRVRGSLQPMAQLPATVGARWVNTVQRWAMPSPAVKFWQLLLDIGASPNWYDFTAARS
jgi:hypothetical protein